MGDIFNYIIRTVKNLLIIKQWTWEHNEDLACFHIFKITHRSHHLAQSFSKHDKMKPNTEVSHNFAYRLQRGGGGGNLTESITVYRKTPVKARICKHWLLFLKAMDERISDASSLTCILDSNPCAEFFSTLYIMLIRGPLFSICFKQKFSNSLLQM